MIHFHEFGTTGHQENYPIKHYYKIKYGTINLDAQLIKQRINSQFSEGTHGAENKVNGLYLRCVCIQ